MLEVDLAYIDTKSTFSKNGAYSIIDVTFCNPSLTYGSDWWVDDAYSNSGHLAIRYSIDYNNSYQQVEEGSTRPLYFTEEVFREAIRLVCVFEYQRYS